MKQTLGSRIALAALAFAFPIAARADLNQTATLVTNNSLNLDSGNTSSGAGGDIFWTGSSIIPQGNAKASNLGVLVGGLDGAPKSLLDNAKKLATSLPIPSTVLVVGQVFAVFTNGGNEAAVIVKGYINNSITLQFMTYGTTTGVGAPTISQVLNNSSNIPAGFPNSGIAPSSLFKILGAGLADSGDTALHETDPHRNGSPLPTTLNGASVTVTTPTTVVSPGLYYATPTQIDAVLPAATPTGPATLTVTYKGNVSVVFLIQVVAAAPGITTYNGSGVAQHALTGALVTYTAPAAPGEVLIIWGTGFGAVGNSDASYDTSAHQTDIQYTIFIGGVPASVSYHGASVYPGVDVFGVTIPSNAPTGCYVPVTAVAGTGGGIVSNSVTLPIAASGACSDPQLGFDGNQLSTLTGKTTVNSGILIVNQSTIPGLNGVPVTGSTASGIFSQTTGASYAGNGTVSLGGCILAQTGPNSSAGTSTGLDAGTIIATGPGGVPVTLSAVPSLAGFYNTAIPSIPPTGASYVFNGSGGSGANAVGSFTATVNFPNPLLSWTSANSAANVTRSQGLLVNWTGGAPGTYVNISGSSANSDGSLGGSYTCLVPVGLKTFTVPSYVLLGLPVGNGITTVQNYTNFTSFSASGLDSGAASGSVRVTVNSNYN